MKNSPIAQLFNQTTVNTDGLNTYLKDIPSYLEAGLKAGSSKHALKLLNYTDFFEYHFRRYLSGRAKTLHGVFREIRQFQQFNETHSLKMIAYSMAVVRETILLNEWYELMPRYLLARQRIEQQFKLNEAIDWQGIHLSSSIYLAQPDNGPTNP